MTDAQIEPAARRLCAIRLLNPDGHAGMDEEGFFQTHLFRAIAEVRAWLEVRRAVYEAGG